MSGDPILLIISSAIFTIKVHQRLSIIVSSSSIRQLANTPQARHCESHRALSLALDRSLE